MLTPEGEDRLLVRVNDDLAVFEEPPVTARDFVMSDDMAAQGEYAWPGVVDELDAIFGRNPLLLSENQEAVLEWAIGAGKSWLVSMAFSYMVYWTLNLKNPQDFFGLSPGSTIVWLNQSINEMQAKRVVFHEVRERFLQAPWFVRRSYLPDPMIRSELRFPKSVVVFPGSSSLTFPAGYNLLGGVLDEAAWFTEPLPGEENLREEPADVIYNSMLRRVRSRFGSRGLLLKISSPRYDEDYIERSYRFAMFGDPDNDVPKPERVYASRKALWDTKPGPERDPETGKWKPWRFVPFKHARRKPDGTEDVLFEMMLPDVFLPDFQKNPEKALRDLAAIASKRGFGFYWDPDIVNRPWQGLGTSGYDPARQHPFDALNRLDDTFRWEETDPDLLAHAHVDLALTRDAAGLAVGHVAQEIVIAGEVKPVIKVDVMLELKAPAGGEIDFQEVRNLLYVLRDRGIPLVFVTFDGFQSADSLQQLRKHGMEAEVLSVDADMIGYDTFKEAVYQGRLWYYRYLPLYQCVKSLIVLRGRKVDHTTTGKKDVTDAVAGICRTLTERWMVQQKAAVGRAPTRMVAAVAGGRASRHGGRRSGYERGPF